MFHVDWARAGSQSATTETSLLDSHTKSERGTAAGKSVGNKSGGGAIDPAVSRVSVHDFVCSLRCVSLHNAKEILPPKKALFLDL
jgi:hypothetical protein